MTDNRGDYLASLIQQIGFEKRSFDVVLNLSLLVTSAAAGLCFNYLSVQRYEVPFIVSGLAFTVVFSLFLRAARAYNNYYIYMMLKNRIVESHYMPYFPDDTLKELIEKVDLRRSAEGKEILNYSRLQLARRVLIRTEYLFLLGGLAALEIISLLGSGLLVTPLSGYIIIAQGTVIALVLYGYFAAGRPRVLSDQA